MSWFSRTKDDSERELLLAALVDALQAMAAAADGRARGRLVRLIERLERPPIPSGLRREIRSAVDQALTVAPTSPDLPQVMGDMASAIADALGFAALLDEELNDEIESLQEAIPPRLGMGDARKVERAAARVLEAAAPARQRALAARREMQGMVVDLAGELGSAQLQSERLSGGVGLLDHTLATADEPEALAKIRGDLVAIARQLAEHSSQLQEGLRRAADQVETLQTALCQAEAELDEVRDQSERDGLTGLLDRAAFDARLREAAKAGARREREHDPSFCLVLLDVDHFKRVNDTYGHPVGDEVLRQISGVLLEQVRERDLVARVGGEEFALVLHGADLSSAHPLVERIRLQVAAQFHASDTGAFSVTVSLGLAEHIAGESALALYKRCDRALYAAKHGGRDQTSLAA